MAERPAERVKLACCSSRVARVCPPERIRLALSSTSAAKSSELRSGDPVDTSIPDPPIAARLSARKADCLRLKSVSSAADISSSRAACCLVTADSNLACRLAAMPCDKEPTADKPAAVRRAVVEAIAMYIPFQPVACRKTCKHALHHEGLWSVNGT